MSKVTDERIKLTAHVLNSAAAGAFVTGVIAPLVAAFYGVPGPAEAGFWRLLLATVIWILVAVCLHMVARALLGRLRE